MDCVCMITLLYNKDSRCLLTSSIIIVKLKGIRWAGYVAVIMKKKENAFHVLMEECRTLLSSQKPEVSMHVAH